MNKLRVGIIGLGVGEQHLEACMAHPNATVVAVCDLSPEKISSIRGKYPSLKIVGTVDMILEDAGIDAVCIASYDNYHYEQIMKALDNGKHVFVEKPLCLYKEEAVKIKRSLKEKPELRISSNLILRKCPRFQLLKNKIENGELGKIYLVEGDYNYGRLHKITEGWRGKIDFYSVVYGGAVHIIDLILWLTGETVTEVSAYGNNISSKGTIYKYNDVAVSILKFSNGSIGKVGSNYSCVYPHFHRLSVYGTKVTFENDLSEGRLFTSRDPKVQFRSIDAPYPGVHKGELLKDFIEAILTGEKAAVGEDDVFKTMSVCFAIEESMNTSKAVKVEYI
ncbi:MAG: Gfo/Idh/MocA family oxidoreductase [Candidatus Omnitrophica bacterium]|nr:Gfo/Idh/MocA family oxidoreductase [Candidatus Omnitrophota bacterium]